MTENDIPADEKEVRQQPNNPLHGITLEKILTTLRAHYSWKELNQRVELNCFFCHPSIKSSLTFLRKKHGARKKVENPISNCSPALKTALLLKATPQRRPRPGKHVNQTRPARENQRPGWPAPTGITRWNT